MSERLAFLVHGTPAPQGSKKFYGGRMVESSKKVGPWREAVVAEILRHGCGDMHLDGPLQVGITFRFLRPKGHYGSRKGQPYLKDDAPTYVTSTPDIDKIIRSTLDALTQSGLIVDDARIASLVAEKRYCYENESPGAFIRISPAT